MTSPNGGTLTTTDTTTVTVNLKEGENWTCTYREQPAAGTLTLVKKHVVNDNGGTAPRTTVDLHVKSGATDVAGSPATRGARAGTSYTLTGGTYSVSETGGPSGYTQTVDRRRLRPSGRSPWSRDDEDLHDHQRRHGAEAAPASRSSTNDNGGTAQSADFTLTADGTGRNDSRAPAGRLAAPTLKADTFALPSRRPAGYSASAWVCVGGTQTGSQISSALGGEATCTITNDDSAPG